MYPVKNYDADTVLGLLAAIEGPVIITVSEGSWAWNPASTKGVIWGPVVIRYTQYPDGGIEAIT